MPGIDPDDAPTRSRLAEGYVQVKPLGPVPVKGLSEPVEVFELTGAGPARTRLQAAAARGLTRFVGRDAELEQLRRRPAARAATATARSSALVGRARRGQVAPRLRVHPLAPHAGLARPRERARSPTARPRSYLPVIDLLKGYFKIEDRDDAREIREKVTGKLLTLDRGPGADAAGPPGPARRARRRRRRGRRSIRRSAASAPSTRVKRLLLRESQVQPLLVVFEDLHWIDAETQALLDSLVESLPDRPAPAAGQLPARVPATPGAARPTTRQLRSIPLPPESAEELLRRAARRRRRPCSPLKRLLIERTEGNPFFLEESVRTLVETGALAGERGAYRLAQPVDSVAGAGDGAGDPGRAHRPARRPRTSGCSRRPRSSARTCRSPLLQAIADVPEDEVLRRARPACRPPSSSTRRGSSRTSSTRSSTRSPTRSRTGAAPRAAARPPRPHRRGDRATLDPTASPSRSSGSPTTPCAARCGRRRSPISARRGQGHGAVRQPRGRSRTSSRRSRRSAASPRPGRRPSRPSTSDSTSGTRSSRSASGRAWASTSTRRRRSPGRSATSTGSGGSRPSW